MAPRSMPFNWLNSKPGARRTPSGRPCSGTASSCFSAQSKMAPTWGKRPNGKVRARSFHKW
eukprot:15334332-Alexandrium_andersonii.AAC.1